jgi:hypothetical protein
MRTSSTGCTMGGVREQEVLVASPALALSWARGAGGSTRDTGRVMRGGRGVSWALVRMDGEVGGEGVSSLKNGGMGRGGGVALGSEGGYNKESGLETSRTASDGTSTVIVAGSVFTRAGEVASTCLDSSVWAGVLVGVSEVYVLGGLLVRFFLFFLASAMVAGPLDKAAHAVVVILGMVVGSKGIVSGGVGPGES